MARRGIVAGVIVLGFVAGGVAIALLTADDSSDTAGRPTTTSAAAPTSSTVATSAPPTGAAASTSTTTTTIPADQLPDPCGAETAAIRAATDNGITGARERAQIGECRLAAVDASWALVQLGAKPGADFAPLTVLVQGGGGTWAVIDQGTANVGCGRAPQQVLVDLGLFCTGTGGAA